MEIPLIVEFCSF